MSADTDRLIAQAREYEEIPPSARRTLTKLALALADVLEAAEARLARERLEHEAAWVQLREYLARAEAAEAQRDALAEALRALASLDDGDWKAGVARARAALAGAAPPEEQP